MKIKSFLITVVLATAVLCFAGFAMAQSAISGTLEDCLSSPTISCLTYWITQMSQQINSLQSSQQSKSLTPAVTPASTPASPTWCYTFNTKLGFAQSNTNDVVQLHTALQKENISYAPDDINTYSKGTSSGIITFQTKYEITPPSGYVGTQTLAELNFLYGCSTAKTIVAAKSPVFVPDASAIGSNANQSSGSGCNLFQISNNNAQTGNLKWVVPIGGTLQLSTSYTDASLPPDNNTSFWSVDDPSLATIDQNGLLTAKGTGFVTINAVKKAGVTCQLVQAVGFTNSSDPFLYITSYSMSKFLTNIFHQGDTLTAPDIMTWPFEATTSGGGLKFSITNTVSQKTTQLFSGIGSLSWQIPTDFTPGTYTMTISMNVSKGPFLGKSITTPSFQIIAVGDSYFTIDSIISPKSSDQWEIGSKHNIVFNETPAEAARPQAITYKPVNVSGIGSGTIWPPSSQYLNQFNNSFLTNGNFTVVPLDKNTDQITYSWEIPTYAVTREIPTVSYQMQISDSQNSSIQSTSPIFSITAPTTPVNVVPQGTSGCSLNQILENGKCFNSTMTVPLLDNALSEGHTIDLTVGKISSSGAVITYSIPSATNDPNASWNCFPHSSGSIFPIGVSLVDCSETDIWLRTFKKSFYVTVNPSLFATTCTPACSSGMVCDSGKCKTNTIDKIITDATKVYYVSVLGRSTADGSYINTVLSNGTLQMSVSTLPSGNFPMTWSVINGTGSATIDQNGLLAAGNVGTVNVVATAKDDPTVFGTTQIVIYGTPACTASNWTSTLSPAICPQSMTQTKTWTQVGTCSGGVTEPATETVNCFPTTWCGNGLCETGETNATCPQDCPAVNPTPVSNVSVSNVYIMEWGTSKYYGMITVKNAGSPIPEAVAGSIQCDPISGYATGYSGNFTFIGPIKTGLNQASSPYFNVVNNVQIKAIKCTVTIPKFAINQSFNCDTNPNSVCLIQNSASSN